MKKPQNLDINEWQNLVDEVKRMDNPPKFVKDGKPLAMRIENTPLTTARHFGGCTYNGTHYVYLEPVVPGELNRLGKPFVAWLLVRDEFLRYVAKRLKKARMKKGDEQCLL